MPINVSTTILCFSCPINRGIGCSLRASWLRDQDHVLVSFFVFFVSFVVVFFCSKWKLWWFLSFSSFLSSSPWVTNFLFAWVKGWNSWQWNKVRLISFLCLNVLLWSNYYMCCILFPINLETLLVKWRSWFIVDKRLAQWMLEPIYMCWRY